MKHPSKLMSVWTLAMALLVVSGVSLAQNSELRTGSPHFVEDGWDVQLGAGLVSSSGELYRGMKDEHGLTGLLDIGYSNGNFYFIANEEDGILLGYSLLRDENWVLDAVLGPKFGMDFTDSDEFDGQLRHLGNREVDGHFGARFTWYGDANRVSMSLTRDVTGVHDGYLATADYQQEWQLRNWLVTGRAGLALFSAKMTNYMAGVSASEATSAFPQFKADPGQAVFFDVIADYPVNENWIFEAKLTLIKISSEFTESPIAGDDTLTVLTTGLKYQF
jgi:MipA family protein